MKSGLTCGKKEMSSQPTTDKEGQDELYDEKRRV